MSVKRWTPVIRAGGFNVTAEIRPVSTTHEVAVLAREILNELEGFSHVFLIYWFHEASSPQLIVKPFLDDATHGVFATRAPCRAPAAAGWSTLTSKLLRCAAAGCVASMPVATRVTAREPPDNWLLMGAR